MKRQKKRLQVNPKPTKRRWKGTGVERNWFEARGEKLSHETTEQTTAGESATNREGVNDQPQKYRMAVKVPAPRRSSAVSSLRRERTEGSNWIKWLKQWLSIGPGDQKRKFTWRSKAKIRKSGIAARPLGMSLESVATHTHRTKFLSPRSSSHQCCWSEKIPFPVPLQCTNENYSNQNIDKYWRLKYK